MREQSVLLEHEADMAIFRISATMPVVDDRVVDADLAGIDRSQSGDEPQQRRLAAAAGSDEGEQLGAHHVDIEPHHSGRRPVGLVDGGELEGGGGHQEVSVSSNEVGARSK